MPGSFPGPVGFAAFAAVKFGGYVLAGVALKKLQPLITASVYKIAAVRTGLGIVIGPLLTIGSLFLLEHFNKNPRSDAPDRFFLPVSFRHAFFRLDAGDISFRKTYPSEQVQSVALRVGRSDLVVPARSAGHRARFRVPGENPALLTER